MALPHEAEGKLTPGPQWRSSRRRMVRKLGEIFDQADTDHDGTLCKAELRDLLNRAAYDEHDGKLRQFREMCTRCGIDLEGPIDELTRRFDGDGDGVVSKQEFLDALQVELELRQIFDDALPVFDASQGRWRATAHNLHQLLQKQPALMRRLSERSGHDDVGAQLARYDMWRQVAARRSIRCGRSDWMLGWLGGWREPPATPPAAPGRLSCTARVARGGLLQRPAVGTRYSICTCAAPPTLCSTLCLWCVVTGLRWSPQAAEERV